MWLSLFCGLINAGVAYWLTTGHNGARIPLFIKFLVGFNIWFAIMNFIFVLGYLF